MKTRLISGLLAVSMVACSDAAGPEAARELAPPDLGDGWAVAAPGDVGLDGRTLEDLSDRILRGDFKHVHGLLVARRGHLAFEGYYNDHVRDSLHTLQSVTKTVGSTLIGIAWDAGLLELDATLPELLPERAAALAADPAKASIRLRDLLSMQAGLRWDEWSCSYRDESCNSNRQMNNSDDWVGFVLDQPVVDPPGSRFIYNSGASNLLAAILRNAADQDPVSYAEERLFEPLGIERHRWFRNSAHPDSLPHFGGGLRLRPRDMAKLGQLFLDDGMWKGVQVVSEAWVNESTRPRARVAGSHWYGYQWWLMPLRGDGSRPGPGDVRFSWGFGGQHFYAIPALDLLVSVNSWNDDGSTTGFEILEEVLAAVR